MPIYEYVCEKCGKLVERIQKVTDAPPKKCEHCGGKMSRVMSRSSFQLKGGGWYKDLYSSTPTKKDGSTENKASSFEGKGDSKGSGSEAKADKKASPVEAKSSAPESKAPAKESKPAAGAKGGKK